MRLSAEDRLDINELPARYADALDFRRPQDLRLVFTDDAIWEVVGGMALNGIDEIMNFMGQDVHPGAHILTNLYIKDVVEDPRDGGPLVHFCCRGVYPLGPSDRQNPSSIFYGHYEDDVVRTPDGWRIRHRRYTHGNSPK